MTSDDKVMLWIWGLFLASICFICWSICVYTGGRP